ncbi:MAG: ACT domain-containing protein [Desulfotomaculales bacterium]
MEIYKYPERYVIISLSPDASLPPPPDNGFYTCIRDKHEVTLVLPEAYAPANATRTASGYRVAMLDTAFALDAIGILAKCSAAMAQVGIPIMVYSGYTTDTFVFHEKYFDRACAILEALTFEAEVGLR